ncbi:MAG: 6-phospho-alpha-glucosidase [Cetobacterium sp.]
MKIKNENKTIVIAGAGSTHTPGIIQSIVSKQKELPLKKLILFDVDSERLNIVKTVMSQYLKDNYKNLEVVSTTDYKEAFTGVDFVFAQIRQGGLKMREFDEKIPLKYDVVGQETCGPGGSISYGIRSIPGIFKIIDEAKKYSPDCWILNYSNPASVVAEATRKKYKNERILNICDMPVAILLSYSKMLGLSNWSDLDPEYFGLNHFGWFTALYDKTGKDRLPELREMILSSGIQPSSDKHHKDKDWQKTWKQYAEILRDYPEYLPNSYLQYYLYSADMVSKVDKNYTRANMVIDGREKDLKNEYRKYLENKEGYKSPVQSFTVFGDFIVDAAVSIAYNKGYRFLVIVENNGAIPNLPNDVMVEVPAYLRSWGPEVISRKPISTFYKGMIENQLASEKLAVEGYFENSYDKLLQAIAINKTVSSTNIAKKILDDFIEANGNFWPELKKEKF